MEQEIFHLMNRKKNKKKKNDISFSRIWTHKCNSHPVDIPKVMGIHDNQINYAYSLLFSDNRALKMNTPTYKKRKINSKKHSNYLKFISNDSEKILNKAYSKINFMKKETKQLYKLNSLSLQKISKTFFKTNRPQTSNFNNSNRNRIESASTNYQIQQISLSNSSKIIPKNSFRNSVKSPFGKRKIEYTGATNEKNDINKIYSNEITKENTSPDINIFSKKKSILSGFKKNNKIKNLSLNKSKCLKQMFSPYSPINFFIDKREEKFRNLINIDIHRLYSTNKKKKLNLSRLNNEYRVQMNKSLHHYKAENHLKELNKFQRDDMSVRQSMEDIKFKMNQKINDRNQGQYYKKQYLKLKEENEKERRENSPVKRPFPDKIPFNILFKDIEKNKNIKVFPNGYKIRAYYDFCSNCDSMQKGKNKELLELGESLFLGHLNNKDYELLYRSLDELFNSLELDPILKYIDKFKNEKATKDKTILNERIKDYFPVLTESEKKIQKIEELQILKNKKEIEEENILDKINETKNLLNIDN